MNHANPEPRKRWFRRWKWWLQLAIGIVLCGLILWIFAFDVRRIPSKSMLPTLQGDEHAGDRVLLNLISPKLRAPRRFEIVAFTDPQNPARDLVKRVVGLPGEAVLLREGDIRINGELYRKNARERRLLKIPLYRSWLRPVTDGFDFESSHVQVTTQNALRILARAGDARGETIISKIAPTDGFERDDGVYEHHSGELPVWDLQFECTVELVGEAGEFAVSLTFDGDEVLFTIKRLSRDGRTNLKIARRSIVRDGAAGAALETVTLFEGDGPVWPESRKKQLAFTNIDNTIGIEIDGVEFEGNGKLPYLCTSRHPYISGSGMPPRSRTGLKFTVNGCDAVVGPLAIYRDLSYEPKGAFGCLQEYRLGQNQYFLLGDFSSDSSDSRVFGAVATDRIVGYVSAILLPISRSRWLP